MLKDKSVLIYDFGLTTEFAVRLARDFGQVFYYCVWEDAFPKSNKALIGEGLEGITRVLNFWDYIDKVDLICFFDTFSGDLVDYLRGKGYRVFGAGGAEILENNRWQGRSLQQKVGLPTQLTTKIIGMEGLIDYLKKNEKKWIKINSFRGDIETFFHENYDETEAQFLGKLMVEMGAKGKTMEFIVEEDLKGVEPGYDGWVVDGQYPPIAMWGYEKKGTGYLGKLNYDENIPTPLREINTKLAPFFKEKKARTFFSSEALVLPDKTGYLIDPCVRAPMPVPSAIHLEIWENFSEIVWAAAGGEIIRPKPLARYGAGICFESSWAEENWTLIDFPPEIRPWVKLRMAFKTKDNQYYALPGFSSLGSVIGLGNTVEEAIKKVEERATLIKAREINFTLSGLREIAEKTIPEGKKVGLDF